MYSATIQRPFFFLILSYLATLATCLPTNGTIQTGKICRSFGVDYKDGETYFINSNSADQFTAISQFQGIWIIIPSKECFSYKFLDCSADNANIFLVQPSSVEVQCSDVPTTPDNTNEISTW